MPSLLSETLPTNPVTVDEHRLCHRFHRDRADALKLKIDHGLLNGMDVPEVTTLVSEYHDELECALYHFVAARLIEDVS
ncbi:MAG TPA: hypothetical protein VM686_00425 [Polyangiaceae bacterium]|jgi:hypothetical protein|nr:hypothetical protein [Polyangiaceae bacterium]